VRPLVSVSRTASCLKSSVNVHLSRLPIGSSCRVQRYQKVPPFFPGKSKVAHGALADAGLTIADVDAFFTAGDNTNLYPLSLVDYLGLDVKVLGSTDTGGSAYLTHVGQAIQAIEAGLLHSFASAARRSPGPRAQPPIFAISSGERARGRM
jgi:hypothetical protein